jgi:hypothetical protein
MRRRANPSLRAGRRRGEGARCLRRATEHELGQFIAAASLPPRGRNVVAGYDSNFKIVELSAGHNGTEGVPPIGLAGGSAAAG